MAKRKTKKKVSKKKAAKKAKKVKIHVPSVQDALADAEAALRIADRNLRQVKKKFAKVKVLKQSRCYVEG